MEKITAENPTKGGIPNQNLGIPPYLHKRNRGKYSKVLHKGWYHYPKTWCTPLISMKVYELYNLLFIQIVGMVIISDNLCGDMMGINGNKWE
jgi:hypothetical protein